MKKIVKMMFVLALLLVQIIPQTLVNAAGTGTISINNVEEGKTYTIYQILALESYNKETGAYAYKATDEWASFIGTDAAKEYLATDENGYVRWVEGADVVAFSKLALEYAKNNASTVETTKKSMTATSTGSLANIQTKTVVVNGEEKEVKYIQFTGLDLGYYLVDSSLGTVCGLTTTNPDAEVNEKNSIPVVKKEVEENTSGTYGSENTAQIGDEVNFKTTITVGKGAINYVLYDTMSEGLTLNGDSITVTSPTETLEKGVDYTVDVATEETPIDGGYTFVITFTNSYLEGLTENENALVVTYNATLNEGAVIESTGNPNETFLKYGDNTEHETEPSKTITYTHDFEVVKTDESKKLLTGAIFNLYRTQTSNDAIDLVLVTEEDQNGYTVYRVATANDTKTTTEIEAGKVRILGLDINTYYLEETQAPDGYNKLPSRVSFTVTNTDGDNLSASDEGVFQVNNGLVIENKTGNILPDTGGIGTMIFILVGTMMVLGFGVLLVTKLRMSKYSA